MQSSADALDIILSSRMTKEHGTDRKAPARGAKLDEKKKEEYLEEVSLAKDWDTIGWTTWTITGRVLPERANVWVAPVESAGAGAGGRFKLRLEVIQSHISATLIVEKTDPSDFEKADIVRTALAFPINYIAFMNRAAYETVLDVCIRSGTAETTTLPEFEPIFDGDDPGRCFTPGLERFDIPYASQNYQLSTALHDLTEAVRYPRRTFDYCRMAVEVVRSFFDPASIKSHRERHIEGEKQMCSSLRIDRASLQSLDAIAARSRHGELVFSISWDLRKKAMELAWEVVARFAYYIKHSAPAENWKALDVKIEESR
jgi:hypothetical protein